MKGSVVQATRNVLLLVVGKGLRRVHVRDERESTCTAMALDFSSWIHPGEQGLRRCRTPNTGSQRDAWMKSKAVSSENCCSHRECRASKSTESGVTVTVIARTGTRVCVVMTTWLQREKLRLYRLA